jgi:hypothetical protein
MTVLGATALTAGTLVNVVISAVVAGLGVTVAFSTVIYCADRASELRRDHRGGAAAALTAGGVLALAVCVGLIVYGLVLITSKR